MGSGRLALHVSRLEPFLQTIEATSEQVFGTHSDPLSLSKQTAYQHSIAMWRTVMASKNARGGMQRMVVG